MAILSREFTLPKPCINKDVYYISAFFEERKIQGNRLNKLLTKQETKLGIFKLTKTIKLQIKYVLS